ncbi:MAG: 6-pyruvoyl tetrahydrobiopterin synthase [Proteobacteria bacterium]|nr:MAG: 6-pyruvoyl tetrahydrobiopterin synthase [Pseudomonadota bacterium]
MVILTRAADFSASLRICRPDLSAEENRARFGRLASQHGHNYRLEVSVRGEPDPVTGMVMDLKDLKAVIEREVMARFDHRDLNRDTPYFEKQPPTPERFALVLFELLRQALGPALHAVRLRQDDDLWVDVQSDAA